MACGCLRATEEPIKGSCRTLLAESWTIVHDGDRRVRIIGADLNANLLVRIAKRVAQQVAEQNGQRVLIAHYFNRFASTTDSNAARRGEYGELGSDELDELTVSISSMRCWIRLMCGIGGQTEVTDLVIGRRSVPHAPLRIAE
jgi:hypothetical protein